MLKLQHLYKSFGQVQAAADFSLDVSSGETVVLMGPSGSGKSTVIRMINRLIEPDSGSILFGNREIIGMAEAELQQVRRKIGFVFQHFNLIGRLTAAENVMLGLMMDGAQREEARVQALAALDKVGLAQRADHKPSELSGGQQQRVGIARALAFAPELMLWDEPTASLDPILVREVLVIMEELARYRASSMLVVTHEIPFALHAADRIVLMDKGKVVEEGLPEQVFARPVSAVGRQYRDLIEYQHSRGQQALEGNFFKKL